MNAKRTSPPRAMTSDDRSLLSGIRARSAAVWESVIPRGTTVAILDAPNQRNVGDSMIWEGELEYVRQLGLHVAYVSDVHHYDRDLLRQVLPTDGVILLHGGGNFGDIWSGHQLHRERVSRDFPDRRIVQLPQSVHFQSAERAAKANAILRDHPDFTLLVRDDASMSRAAQSVPDVAALYCWDAAFGWQPRSISTRRARPPLVLARSDRESNADLASHADRLGTDVEVTDWVDPRHDTAAWRAARRVTLRLERREGASQTRLRQAVFRRAVTTINASNVAGGVRLMRNRPVVVVDRLHAHVMCILLGVPHVLVDNNYGKLGAVFDDYSGEFSTAHYADDPSAAFERARQISMER